MPDSLIITPGKEFAADCWVHTPLPANPTLDPNSASYVASLVKQISGSVASVNITSYSPPIYLVDDQQPTQAVMAVRAFDSSFNTWGVQPLMHELAAVAIPSDMQPSAGTDQEVVIYCPKTGQYWEMWVTQSTGANITLAGGELVPQWQAAWGGYMGPSNMGGQDTLATNDGHYNYHYWSTDKSGANMGVTATSIPFLAGIMTIAEQRAGVINHALGFACPLTAPTFVYPAQRSDGSTAVANGGIPEGTMFTFPATLDLTTFGMGSYAMMIAKAVQKYGMVLWDTAGNVTFRAENPGNRYAIDPYWGPWGILNPTSADHTHTLPGMPPASDYPDSNNRLYGFPWSQLIAITPPAK